MLVRSDLSIAPTSTTIEKRLGPVANQRGDPTSSNRYRGAARRRSPSAPNSSVRQPANRGRQRPQHSPLDSHGRCSSEGDCTMDSCSAERELGVESELIDLSAISMTALRELDDTAFRKALRHVTRQTAHPREASASGSERERVD